MSQNENDQARDIKFNSERSDLEPKTNSENEFGAKEKENSQSLSFSGILLLKLKELYIQNFGHIENPEFCRKKLGMSIATFYRHVNGEIKKFRLAKTLQIIKNNVYNNWMKESTWTTPKDAVDKIFNEYIENTNYRNQINQDIIDAINKVNEKNAHKNYAKIIVEKYKADIIKARRKLGFGFNLTRLFNVEPITRNQLKSKGIRIEEITSKKGRSKYFWYGLVYRIDDVINNKSYAGLTVNFLKDRWHFNLSIALETPDLWSSQLLEAIRNYLYGNIDEGNLGLTENFPIMKEKIC